MRTTTQSLIVASAILCLGICPSHLTAACNCKTHQTRHRTHECSGPVPTRRPDCSGDPYAAGTQTTDTPDVLPDDQVNSAEPLSEAQVEDDAPVLEAIEEATEETPTEAPPLAEPPVTDEAPISEAPAPRNPLPVEDAIDATQAEQKLGASTVNSPAVSGQPASSTRSKDKARFKRPYSQPTLDKVPNPPVPDTTEVQLREIPIEFDSYGYLRRPVARRLSSQSRAPVPMGMPQSLGQRKVAWSATGNLIR